MCEFHFILSYLVKLLGFIQTLKYRVLRRNPFFFRFVFLHHWLYVEVTSLFSGPVLCLKVTPGGLNSEQREKKKKKIERGPSSLHWTTYIHYKNFSSLSEKKKSLHLNPKGLTKLGIGWLFRTRMTEQFCTLLGRRPWILSSWCMCKFCAWR